METVADGQRCGRGLTTLVEDVEFNFMDRLRMKEDEDVVTEAYVLRYLVPH